MEFESRVVKLSTGALQDLWDAIREACAAQHAVTIDLEGASFSGRAVGLQIALCEGTKATYDKAFNIAPKYPLTIQGGRIDLGHYSILVSGGSCCFKQVEISGSGPAWRQRTLASLMHATGRMTTLRLEDTTLHSSAQGPTNTLLVDNAAHVTLLRSKVSHSNNALGIKVLGGSLDARDTEFTGHHESLAVLTTPNARSPGDGKAPSMLGGEDSSMVKLWGCTLTGAGPGTIGTVCSVIGARSSLSAMQCVIRGAAVGAVVSRGAWLVIEDCTISDSHVAGVWCSGGHSQATECLFHSHPQPAVRIERKGSMELRRCTFQAPEQLPDGAPPAVGLSIDGNGAFARSVDCKYEGFGASAIVETAGGSFLVEEGVEDAIRLPAT